MDDFNSLWNRLQLRTGTAVGPGLAQDIVRDCFNQLVERRTWSWRRKSSAFFPNTFYNTGTATTVSNSNVVTGNGTAWTGDFAGKQFRGGAPPSSFPTYTILAVLSPTSLLLDRPWAGASLTAQYQIFQCYFPVPPDFQEFESLVNPTNSRRLWTNLTQFELDTMDPQRVQTGVVYASAFLDYTQNYNGLVGPVLQVIGSGPSPVSTTTQGYSFPAASVFVIQITTGGTVGTAAFKWKQDNGSYTTGVLTAATPIDLAFGVQVFFPAGTYVLGETFIVQATIDAVPSVPRYELWPRPIGAPYVLPYLYIAKLPALTPDQPQLPPFIAQRGDVLLEMALAQAARFPGTDTMANPYSGLPLALQHEARAEKMISELEKKDDDTAIQDLSYKDWPFYPAPWMDGSWQQQHAPYY